jgi:hypothetical protein
LNYLNCSRNQLEEIAEKLLRKFDPERLTKCKPIDVYSVIESCLKVPYDWKYLSPDQSILGMTAFQSGWVWIWPKPYYKEGLKPSPMYVEKGTILIDSTLTENDKYGAENFTVMHEVFHQILHKQYFQQINNNYPYATMLKSNITHRSPMTPLEICEYQANACAAAFLMPAGLVAFKLKQFRVDYKLDFRRSLDRSILLEMAKDFNVTKTAMKYRLINLGYAVQEHWN